MTLQRGTYLAGWKQLWLALCLYISTIPGSMAQDVESHQYEAHVIQGKLGMEVTAVAMTTNHKPVQT